MEGLINQMLSYGAAPAILVITFLLGWVIKELKDNARRDDQRADELKRSTGTQIDAMESRLEERLAAVSKRQDELANRVSCIEKDYLPREEHYKEFSGWRAELNRLSDLIISVFKEKK